jgi:hypothetical protein
MIFGHNRTLKRRDLLEVADFGFFIPFVPRAIGDISKNEGVAWRTCAKQHLRFVIYTCPKYWGESEHVDLARL